MSYTKTNICPLCGDMVRESWVKCSRCGGSLLGTPSAPRKKHRVSMAFNRKAAIHLAENSPKREKTGTCPMCGDIVKAGWGQCPRCGESLEEVMAFPSLWYETPTTSNRRNVLSRIDEPPRSRVEISACTLCGDMVKEDWGQCPRCGEILKKV